jgi:PPOX class probable F420-dependent enzyme
MNATPRPHAAAPDPAVRIRRFLESEGVVWLATTGEDGRPSVVPVWFLWDGEAILVASKPHARKVTNIRSNPAVMIALGDADEDFDVGLVEATGRLVDVPTRLLLAAGLQAKYARRMAELGLGPAEFAATYSQVLRIEPDRWLAWHGRTARPGARPAPTMATRLTDGLRRLRKAIERPIWRPLTPAHA